MTRVDERSETNRRNLTNTDDAFDDDNQRDDDGFMNEYALAQGTCRLKSQRHITSPHLTSRSYQGDFASTVPSIHLWIRLTESAIGWGSGQVSTLGLTVKV
jgi:hypothetical protein